MIPTYEYRRQAREVLKKWLQVLALIAMIAALPGLINATVTLMTGADPMNIFADPVAELTRQAAAIDSLTDQQAYDALSSFVTSVKANFDTYIREKAWIFTVATLFEVIFTPVLVLGFHNGALRAVRGKEISGFTVLSRTNDFFRALGLSLFRTLLIFLWMLPGMIITWLSAFLPVPGLNSLVMTAGIVLMFFLGIRARCRYAMAFFFLADTPFQSPLAAINCSRDSMKGHIMELFMLDFSFAGWLLLVFLLSGVFPGAFGLMVQLFATLLVQVYMDTSRACFYEKTAMPTFYTPPSANDDLT